ncbi:MAG: hypothetical protein GX303_07480 [Clostridiales bacterium]|nr:hypothetical protein [Clostridiales bacterium]
MIRFDEIGDFIHRREESKQCRSPEELPLLILIIRELNVSKDELAIYFRALANLRKVTITEEELQKEVDICFSNDNTIRHYYRGDLSVVLDNKVYNALEVMDMMENQVSIPKDDVQRMINNLEKLQITHHFNYEDEIATLTSYLTAKE